MNLEHIKLFVAVYRAGSFATVAKDLNVAASSVSRAVATLEAQLNTRLFQRTTRNLTPTQAGERYFQRVEALVEEFEIAHQEIIDQSLEPSGRLRVTASVSFGQIVIAPLLKAFHEQYPNIYLELTLSDTRANMITDQFDVAIRHGRLPDSSFVARKLAEVNYVLVASPGYLKQVRPITTPEEIPLHSLISFTYPEFSKAWCFRRNGTEQVMPIKPFLTLTTASVIRDCVKNGMGVAMLADWTVKEDISNGSLVQLLPDWDVSGVSFDTAIWLVYPSRAFTPAKTAAFTDFLIRHLAPARPANASPTAPADSPRRIT
ncbi:MAG: LysR family transcriptional regulator [Hahellaceae bacterium]|nr:LysR family transcriptional regulator [Hahellaceae bacterium]